MPKPAEAGHRYVPGLDGLRALAVLAVILYHLNAGWAQGGLLAVGVFFTLSGYLITDLLLEHWGPNQSLGLSNFWLRRARRYVGSHVSSATRITRMMSIIGNQPVMWVNVKSLVSSGPYSESNMAGFDRALVAACSSYPNMRIYNWASAVQPRWFIKDGIHYSTPGSAQRAHLIAQALAEAFPRAREHGYPGCLIP
jgi:peptidoglycan/LPS O-acetylase OafA/YrhL